MAAPVWVLAMLVLRMLPLIDVEQVRTPRLIATRREAAGGTGPR
jgi:hypothetical protein